MGYLSKYLPIQMTIFIVIIIRPIIVNQSSNANANEILLLMLVGLNFLAYIIIPLILKNHFLRNLFWWPDGLTRIQKTAFDTKQMKSLFSGSLPNPRLGAYCLRLLIIAISLMSIPTLIDILGIDRIWFAFFGAWNIYILFSLPIPVILWRKGYKS